LGVDENKRILSRVPALVVCTTSLPRASSRYVEAKCTLLEPKMILIRSLQILRIIIEFEVEPEMYGPGGDRLVLQSWWSRLACCTDVALIRRCSSPKLAVPERWDKITITWMALARNGCMYPVWA